MKRSFLFYISLVLLIGCFMVGQTASAALIPVEVPGTQVYWLAGTIYGTSEESTKGQEVDDPLEPDIFIDLTNETIMLPDGYTVAAYSVDNGAKWKVGALPTGAAFSKLFGKKAVTLVVTNAWDATTKAPAKGVKGVAAVVESWVHEPGCTDDSTPLNSTNPDCDYCTVIHTPASPKVEEVKGAITIVFAKVEARPDKPKLAVNYYLYSPLNTDNDLFDASDNWVYGDWTLTEKNKNEAYAKIGDIVITPAGSDKKADNDKWDTIGLNIRHSVPIDAQETVNGKLKTTKTTYFIRVNAKEDGTKFIPNSLSQKISVSTAVAAPKIKPDYKKEIIKGKATISLGIEDTTGYVFTPFNSTTPTFGLADLYGSTVYAYIPANAAKPHKPGSAPETIVIAPRATIETSGTDLTINKGKVKLGEFELLGADGKYSNKVPVLTATSGTLTARIKATAKAKLIDGIMTYVEGGFAASANGSLAYTRGDIDEKTPPTQGFLTAKVTP